MSRYEIKQINIDNDYIQYPSPSEILGQLSKDDALIQWAVNQTIEHIKTNYWSDSLWCYTIHGTDIDKIKTAWKQVRKNTADIGTELHNLIETFINIKLDYYKGRSFTKDFITLKKENDYLNYISKQSYQLKQMFYQFYNWQKKNVKYFIESEKPICNKTLCYAGTLDFIYMGHDNKIYCVDLKTSNTVYKDHEIQAVSYKYARELMSNKYKVIFTQDGQSWKKIFDYTPIKIDKCAILKISRDYFEPVKFKIIKDVEYKMQSFDILLSFFYVSAKRKMNNDRAKNRR